MKADILRVRGKSLKIICSEEDAANIVMPFVNMTAYVLGVMTHESMPKASSFAASVSKAKIRMCHFVANAIKEKVLPSEMSNFSIEVVPIGGYFKVRCQRQTQVDGQVKMQTFVISLVSEHGLTLFGKLKNIDVTNHPKSTDEQSNARVFALMREMGV